jgi:8-oxo-dGTP pyrophosphatase MutT (NUDIX family)
MQFDPNYPKKVAIPFVGAIIEREHNGNTELLLQTRWKPEKDPVYSGTLEFPAGALDEVFENVYDTLAREIHEEVGLTLKCIKNDSQTKVYSPKGDDASFGFKPFCNVQQLKNGLPWVGFIFLCEVEDGEIVIQESEARDTKWFAKEEVKKLFENEPERLFTLELPAWEYYFKQ